MLLPRAAAVLESSTITKLAIRHSSLSFNHWYHTKEAAKLTNKNFSVCLVLSSLSIKNCIKNCSSSQTIGLCGIRLNSSTTSGQHTEFNFEKDCEETLESLSEHFEEILEGNKFRNLHRHAGVGYRGEADILVPTPS